MTTPAAARPGGARPPSDSEAGAVWPGGGPAIPAESSSCGSVSSGPAASARAPLAGRLPSLAPTRSRCRAAQRGSCARPTLRGSLPRRLPSASPVRVPVRVPKAQPLSPPCEAGRALVRRRPSQLAHASGPPSPAPGLRHESAARLVGRVMRWVPRPSPAAGSPVAAARPAGPVVSGPVPGRPPPDAGKNLSGILFSYALFREDQKYLDMCATESERERSAHSTSQYYPLIPRARNTRFVARVEQDKVIYRRRYS